MINYINKIRLNLIKFGLILLLWAKKEYSKQTWNCIFQVKCNGF